jgi:hypothetical protein
MALVQVPGERAVHIPADNYWALTPVGDGKRSVLFELTMPPQGLVDPAALTSKRPVYLLKLDEKGLMK